MENTYVFWMVMIFGTMKISKQIEFMKKFNYKISHTSYEIIDDHGNFKSLRRAKDFSSYRDILSHVI